MLLRCHRSFYGKIIVLGIVLFSFIIYMKLLSSNFESVNGNKRNQGLAVSDDDEQIAEPSHLIHTNEVSSYELEIRADLAKQKPGLGDEGKAVHLDGIAQQRGDEIYKKIALNEELSEQLPYDRKVPDSRNPLCKFQSYDLSVLPTASVIIIFYNEPYSVLLRTVHSVLNTSDKQILKEIILVDDGSSNEELHGKLDYYVETRLDRDIVKVLRLKNRLGLIRARLAGAREATGDVFIFLDAHCEAMVSWMEPLLARIKESPTSVLVPIIDVIDSKDFQYSTNGVSKFQIGGFMWNGHFDWVDIPDRERERQKKECDQPVEICPTNSPTMAGGLFAIDRKYFWEIGSYDEQMDGWGGENLEMSFRIWQCGGSIETIPCSRVGHVFRDFHPYSFPNDRDTHGLNTARMALVWMDDYMNLFFLNRPDLKFNPDIGDVTHRIMLRKKLKCKSFDWFLKNIYPEKFIPTQDVQYFGKIKSLSDNFCLDDLQQDNEQPFNIGLYYCLKKPSKSQLFSLTNDGVLRNELSCATVQKSNYPPHLVVMVPCFQKNKYNERWKYVNGQFVHLKTKMCLDHRGLQNRDYLEVAHCDNSSDTQRWEFVH